MTPIKKYLIIVFIVLIIIFILSIISWKIYKYEKDFKPILTCNMTFYFKEGFLSDPAERNGKIVIEQNIITKEKRAYIKLITGEKHSLDTEIAEDYIKTGE